MSGCGCNRDTGEVCHAHRTVAAASGRAAEASMHAAETVRHNTPIPAYLFERALEGWAREVRRRILAAHPTVTSYGDDFWNRGEQVGLAISGYGTKEPIPFEPTPAEFEKLWRSLWAVLP